VESRTRDPLTSRYFNDRFVVRLLDRERMARRSERLFGRVLGDLEWGQLVGALDDATVDVRAGAGGAAVHIVVHHPLLRVMERSVARDLTGRTFISNEQLFLHPDAPAGLGTRILAHQIRQAVHLGVAYIRTTALRGPRANGYYTWPLLGFTAPLPDATRRRLPPDLRGATDLHGLFSRPGGAEWWREHGETIEVQFDLGWRSRSLLRLRAYLERRAIHI
jgi:hypothetical protein